MRKKFLQVLLPAALVVLVAFAFVGCGGEETTTTSSEAVTSTSESSSSTESTVGPPAGEPVVIGAVVSATGAGAPLGEPERNVLEMMEEQVNAAGGVLGRPVDIIVLDDKSDPKEAVTAVNRLIQQEKAVAVLAATISSSTLAVKPVLTEAGIPQLAMAASNAITDDPIDWVWRTPPKDALAAARALKYISETLKVTKIAVLHDENAFGSSGVAEIEKTAPDHGLEIVAKESYKTEETDLTAQLTKIKGASPEALIVWGTNPAPAIAAKNMKQLGMTIPYVGSHGIANKTFIDLAGDAAEGVVFPAGKIIVPASITDPQQKAVTDAFIAAYTAKYGQAPNTFAGHAFDALTLLLNAITVSGGTDPAGIQKALNETTGFPGPDGIYNYSATDHDGLSVDDMIMVKIEGGTWVQAE